MTLAARTSVLLSAHRGGCGRSKDVENTLAAFEAAVLLPIEYIEFDIQRTRDGVFLLNHEDRVHVHGRTRYLADMTADEVDTICGPRVRYTDVLALLAVAGRKAHLDFKFTSPAHLYSADAADLWEVEAVRIALSYLPADEFIVTSCEDQTVRGIRDWADATGHDLTIGLSIGRHRLTGMTWRQAARWRVGEMFPGHRIHRSGANLVVAQRHLARVRLLAWAHRHNLRVLVWTVDGDRELARLMSDSRVWMITSNFPERGLAHRTPQFS